MLCFPVGSLAVFGAVEDLFALAASVHTVFLAHYTQGHDLSLCQEAGVGTIIEGHTERFTVSSPVLENSI